MSDPAVYPLSVVIPTLGGACLAGTIEQLNQGERVPAEILVCIPHREAPQANIPKFSNVQIVVTPARGQVAQRASGFRRVSQPLVLQLDDDIVLPPGDLQRLVQAAQHLGSGNAVAPIYRDLETGRCLHAYHRRMAGWLQTAYAYVICGAPWGKRRMGSISSGGVGFGIDEQLCGSETIEAQWLPGGCVICHREDLITEDFFPFAGKAYCEDLIHSLLRRRRGIRLWVLPGAYCMTPAAPLSFNWSSVNSEIKARAYVVRLSGGKLWRLVLWYVMDVPKRMVLAARERAVSSS
jgi:GT2 family glycosyltransferase